MVIGEVVDHVRPLAVERVVERVAGK